MQPIVAGPVVIAWSFTHTQLRRMAMNHKELSFPGKELKYILPCTIRTHITVQAPFFIDLTSNERLRRPTGRIHTRACRSSWRLRHASKAAAAV